MNRPISEEKRQAFRADPGLLESEYRRLTGKQNSEFAAAVVGENQAAYDAVSAPRLRLRRRCDLAPATHADVRGRCKRLVMSSTFYEAMQRPNATLVTDRIARVTPTGIATVDGREHPLDVLVLATGFDTLRPSDACDRARRSDLG